MTDTALMDAYGTITEPATLKIQRLLPGPVERVWDYLTRSEMRRQWLASGDMELAVGAPFELVWRNNELTDPPGTPPDGYTGHHELQTELTAVEPLKLLSYPWGTGQVTFTLEPQGKDVLLTVTHERVRDRAMLLSVSTGWHAHLDLLADRLAGRTPKLPFWDGFRQHMAIYDARLPK